MKHVAYLVKILNGNRVPVTIANSSWYSSHRSSHIGAQRERQLNTGPNNLQRDEIMFFVVSSVVQQQTIFRLSREPKTELD